MNRRFAIVSSLPWLIFGFSAQAAVIHVPSEVVTIQAAVDQAQPGDTVLVSPGSYYENVQISLHPITLAGEWLTTGDTTLISQTSIHGDPDESYQRPVHITTFSATATVISGVTLRDGWTPADDYGAGIRADTSAVILDHCHLLYNETFRGGAGYFRYSALEVRNCLVSLNTAEMGAAGLLGVYARLNVDSSTFSNNFCSYGTAALSWTNLEGEISNSLFLRNSAGPVYGAVTLLHGYIEGHGSWKVRGNEFRENNSGQGAGFRTTTLDTLYLENNIFQNNLVWFDQQEGAPGAGSAVALSAVWFEIAGNVLRQNTGQFGPTVSVSGRGEVHHNQFIENCGGYQSVLSVGITNNLEPSAAFYRNLVIGNTSTDTPFPGWEYAGALFVGTTCTLSVTENDFIENQALALGRAPLSSVTAINNYWGSRRGPYLSETGEGGPGDTLGPGIEYLPFSQLHFWAPRAEVSTPQVDFGEVELSTTATCTLTLRGASVQTVHLVPGDATETGFSWGWTEELALREGEESDVLLHFTPVAEGEFAESLWLETDNPVDPLLQVRVTGTGFNSSASEEGHSLLPAEFDISQPRPNPFNAATRITLTLPVAANVRLELIDLLGRSVLEVHRGPLAAGWHEVVIDAADLPSGLYFLKASRKNTAPILRRLMVLK